MSPNPEHRKEEEVDREVGSHFFHDESHWGDFPEKRSDQSMDEQEKPARQLLDRDLVLPAQLQLLLHRLELQFSLPWARRYPFDRSCRTCQLPLA